jgi:hypothetical protein
MFGYLDKCLNFAYHHRVSAKHPFRIPRQKIQNPLGKSTTIIVPVLFKNHF